MFTADSEARATVEAMLPAAHRALRDALAHPPGSFECNRGVVLRFDGFP